MARSASLILRSSETSLVSRKFFATCCVMVEAPSGRRLVPMRAMSVSAARSIDIGIDAGMGIEIRDPRRRGRRG